MFSANTSQVSADQVYVEDVFSTYLYTGNGSTQTITNGIDLAGKGGLVWSKGRSGTAGTTRHNLFDTNRGRDYLLISNTTEQQQGPSPSTDDLVSFNSNGFSLGPAYWGNGNVASSNYATWTFRKAPKFFDVVTYTGNGVAGRTISHNLGVAPGCIIVKQTSGTENWRVYHRSTGNGQSLYLNTTDAALGTSVWNSTSPTSTDFTVSGSPAVNGSGSTYVAYLFAHDTTSDGIIQCGSFTLSGSPATVNLGWEPQWVMIKSTSSADDWWMYDNMRGMAMTDSAYLRANVTFGEANWGTSAITPTATGFTIPSGVVHANGTYVYIAIRRGPMRTPTSGTSVFSPLAVNNSNGTINTIGFPYDMQMVRIRSDGPAYFFDRLRGVNSTTSAAVTTPYLQSTTTGAEATLADFTRAVSNTGFTTTSQLAGVSNIYWNFSRAPSFFDVVCYTGTGSTTIPHNLGVAPEMMIVKSRSAINDWYVYSASIGATKALRLNVNGTPLTTSAWWNNTAPTSTVFTVGSDAGISGVGTTFVAYLFASCPGVSKVGSYTGNGSSQTINCGFAAGARFVMIKRTDSTGDWYVWDSARGIVAGNDPRLSLNNTNAEVTTDDSVDTDSSGFVVNQLSATNINVSSATYIYLAVA